MPIHSLKWLLFTLATVLPANAQSTSDEEIARVTKQSIKWAPCPHPGSSSLECATLAVPLNYTAGAGSETIDLQLTKVNAFKQPSKGSILFNPGGPGATGRDIIRQRQYGLAFMYMTGGEHDLISFNPRGTGNTLPFSCSTDTGVGLDDNVNDLLSTDTNDTGALCAKAMGDTGRLVGTTFVARDMMRIVDALGEDGMLRYWGMSYGTVLGATVAAMFPDRMDKIVLDGVANLAEYWAGEPIEQLMDTEAVIDGFFLNCVNSPEYCLLAANGSSAADLRRKFNDVFAMERSSSIDGAYSGFISTVSNDIAVTAGWPQLSSFLNLLFNFMPNSEAESSPEFDHESIHSVASNQSDLEALFGIRCGDSKFRASKADEATQMMKAIELVAPTLGDTLTPLVGVCSTWPMTAEERYTGPFENIETKNPILFIGNTHDPRTPLVSARNTSSAFPESVLLTLDGYGHCSTSQPSLCIGKAVQAYFSSGTLPAKDAVCAASVPPFHDSSVWNIDSVEALLWADGAADDDDALLAAWSHVGREMSLSRGSV